MQPRRNVRCRSTPIAATSLAFAIAVMGFLAGERDARAQNAEAEALFQEGNRLMDRRKFAQACDAYEASNRLEPGAGVLLYLGDCRVQNEQLASAWAAYKAALSRAKTPKKRVAAQERIAELAPRISYLTVSISDDSRVTGISLTSNGEPLDPTLWNQAVPVDGGDYVIASSAPGHEEWQTTAYVPNEGAKVSVTVPKLKELSKPGLLPRPPPAPPAELPVHEPERSKGAFTMTREIAIGVAGASVIGVVAGTVLGVSAKRKQNDAFKLCPDPNAPCAGAPEAQALIKSGRSQALEANIALGIGAAAAIGAGVLWFVGAPEVEGPRRVSVVPSVVPGETGIVVMGRF